MDDLKEDSNSEMCAANIKNQSNDLQWSIKHKFFVVLAEAKISALVLCCKHLNLIVMMASHHKLDEGSSWPVPATGCRALHVDHVQAADSASNNDNSCSYSSQKEEISRIEIFQWFDFVYKVNIGFSNSSLFLINKNKNIVGRVL